MRRPVFRNFAASYFPPLRNSGLLYFGALILVGYYSRTTVRLESKVFLRRFLPAKISMFTNCRRRFIATILRKALA